MPKQEDPSTQYSLLIIGPDGAPGPTMGNYDSLQEAVDNWAEMYSEEGPDIAIVRVFSLYNAKLNMYEITKIEVVSEEEVESVSINEMSDTNFGDLVDEMTADENFVADEHPDWDIKEFHAIVNYTTALDDEWDGSDVPPISTHDNIEDAKAEFKAKGYSADYSIVVRQLKVNPANPKEYYLFDEWDVE